MRIGEKIVKEEGLDELINYMFFNNKILKLVKYATQLMTQGQKNTLITELRLIKKQMERDKENG
jgi:uncharacterized membrane protein YfbV (UPF0208 family)